MSNLTSSKLAWNTLAFWKKLQQHLTLVALAQLGLGLAGVASVLFGFWSYYQGAQQTPCYTLKAISSDLEPACKITTDTSTTGVNQDSDSGQIQVYVAGAVQSPGIVSLPEGSRLAAALAAAGDLDPTANPQYIARQLNLATKLTDQAKIYVPFDGESLPVDTQAAQTDQKSTATPSKISINTATQSSLEELPMIGPKRAESIIDGRPYQQIDELLSRDILTESQFQEIESKISL